MSDRRTEREHIADEVSADSPAAREDEELLAAFEAELRGRGARPPVHFQLDWAVGWSLLATVQLACRHEGFVGQAREIAAHFGRELEKQLVLGPASAAIAARGWAGETPEAPNLQAPMKEGTAR